MNTEDVPDRKSNGDQAATAEGGMGPSGEGEGGSAQRGTAGCQRAPGAEDG